MTNTEVPVNATDTVQETPPVERAEKNLRVCRGYMLAIAGVLDEAGESEAVHYLRTSLTSLDDCLDALEKPEQSMQVLPSHMGDVFATRDTIADDRRDDLMADADRSEYR
jgi:hypothetical protein